jgi:RND family efflux transporter MFP subunit
MLALGWWIGQRTPAAKPSATSGAAKQLWTCGMHPQVIQDAPGLCPICHMELTPLSHGAGSAGLLTIDPVVVQNMGVRIEKVRRAPLRKSARFAGNVLEPENSRREVVVRVAGWIRTLQADTTGMEVGADAPLFELDSPELSAAIEELLAAGRARGEAKTELSRKSAESVHDAARRRLLALGLTEEQVAQYESEGKAPATVRFTTHVAAHVLELLVRAGQRVEPGTRLMTLSDRREMWIDFAVPEGDLSWLHEGSHGRVHVAALGTHVLEGPVSLVLPHLDMTTRTARARIVVENPDMQLREGMSAEVSASALVEEAPLTVPREAVIDTGERQVAFVALGAGRFEARDVELGPEGDQGLVAVHAGLAEGEDVVVSGQFLLDAESRIREAIRRHLGRAGARSARARAAGRAPGARGPAAGAHGRVLPPVPRAGRAPGRQHARRRAVRPGAALGGGALARRRRAERGAATGARGHAPGARPVRAAGPGAPARVRGALRPRDPPGRAPAALDEARAAPLHRALHDGAGQLAAARRGDRQSLLCRQHEDLRRDRGLDRVRDGALSR